MSHSLLGAWVLGREGDPNVGPQLSYDGNPATKWNPQASGNYAQEQGIVYTLNSWFDLEEIKWIALTQLGMQYASEGQIVNIEGGSNDYLRKHAEIP